MATLKQILETAALCRELKARGEKTTREQRRALRFADRLAAGQERVERERQQRMAARAAKEASKGEPEPFPFMRFDAREATHEQVAARCAALGISYPGEEKRAGAGPSSGSREARLSALRLRASLSADERRREQARAARSKELDAGAVDLRDKPAAQVRARLRAVFGEGAIEPQLLDGIADPVPTKPVAPVLAGTAADLAERARVAQERATAEARAFADRAAGGERVNARDLTHEAFQALLAARGTGRVG